MTEVSSAYWIDVKTKLIGNSTESMEGILLDASKKLSGQLVVFIVYDLPNRDCHVSRHLVFLHRRLYEIPDQDI